MSSDGGPVSREQSEEGVRFRNRMVEGMRDLERTVRQWVADNPEGVKA